MKTNRKTQLRAKREATRATTPILLWDGNSAAALSSDYSYKWMCIWGLRVLFGSIPDRFRIVVSDQRMVGAVKIQARRWSRYIVVDMVDRDYSSALPHGCSEWVKQHFELTRDPKTFWVKLVRVPRKIG